MAPRINVCTLGRILLAGAAIVYMGYANSGQVIITTTHYTWPPHLVSLVFHIPERFPLLMTSPNALHANCCIVENLVLQIHSMRAYAHAALQLLVTHPANDVGANTGARDTPPH